MKTNKLYKILIKIDQLHKELMNEEHTTNLARFKMCRIIALRWKVINIFKKIFA